MEPTQVISRQLQWKRDKIAAGICAQCGVEPHTNGYHCNGCTEKHRARKGFKPWQPGSRGRVPAWYKKQQAAQTA